MPPLSSEMREMGSSDSEQRQRLLMSRTGSFGAPSVRVAASARQQSRIEYPAGVASAILSVAASGYLSGCFFVDLYLLHGDSGSTVSAWQHALCMSTGWLSSSGAFS